MKHSSFALPNLFLGGFLLFLIHLSLLYYFDFGLDLQKGWWEAATTGAIAIIFSFLPSNSKEEIYRKFASAIQSKFSFISLALLSLLFLSILSIFLRTIIVWPKGEGTIYVGQKAIKAESQISLDANQASIYGFPFTSLPITVGEYKDKIIFKPFSPYRYDVPESAIYSSSYKYKEITTLLSLSFYQYVEARMLENAKGDFDSQDTKRFVDLNLVYNILDLCFVKTDISRSGDTLLERYSSSYPSSSWINLLKSCQSYSHRNYAEAVSILKEIPSEAKTPLKETYLFFRAVNHLRAFIEASNNNSRPGPSELVAAHDDLIAMTKSLDGTGPNRFKKIALPTANVFIGIINVYQHKLDEADTAFSFAAASTDYPEIRARALSDQGYVKLLLGDLSAGKSLFSQALETDAQFPYARTNLGYTLLAEGDYKKAREKFSDLIADKDLNQSSRRDVVLSQIAVAHIDNETKGIDPDAYKLPMKELGLYDYDSVNPELLRMAHIHLAIANDIYLSPSYYGLEILALSMLARSYNESSTLPNNKEAFILKSRSMDSFKRVAKTVDPRCFIFKIDHGFFKPVADLYKVISEESAKK